MNIKQLALIMTISIATSVLVSFFSWRSALPSINPADTQSTNLLNQKLVNQQEQINELKAQLAATFVHSNMDSSKTAGTRLAQASTISEVEDIEPETETAVLDDRPVLNADQIRRQRLIDSGFAAADATWIMQNEAEVQLESLYEQHRARRAQVELEQSNGTRAKSRLEQLRERLGDDYYERYLQANGLPTSVGVRSVLDRSPGANAGLQAGDRIVSYAGERVFNIRDLNGLTVLGQAGETVLIEVERDGNPVQLSIPRGPIGITGGRGRF